MQELYHDNHKKISSKTFHRSVCFITDVFMAICGQDGHDLSCISTTDFVYELHCTVSCGKDSSVLICHILLKYVFLLLQFCNPLVS